MVRNSSEIATAIDQFQPQEEEWLELDELLEELFESESPASGIPAMLRVFERYPTEDRAGVFWSIIHGMESLPGYEPLLIESIQSAPSESGLIMVNRLLNSGVTQINGLDLVQLFEKTTQNRSAPAEVRESARRFLKKHQSLD
ncbi:hypothetical protein Pan153_00760 [Gimesia panareensis]|uniref:HEAT repeat protein n=1 Tax=Gimesia panareensis TaxID=2527978 RepID=A0A518FGJ5_9PLAN|nr:hypothetical protein [Gimesia panareensis]QDV15462.1 hypothetical protein Pan153_00760 [Gimesia panareensis]